MFVLQIIDELATEDSLSEVARQAGWDHFDGKCLNDNPYIAGTKYAKAWESGYRTSAYAYRMRQWGYPIG